MESGIPGLDSLLDGGIPRGSVVLLCGRAGTGKSIFGTQFLWYGASRFGEKSLYISFTEDRTRLLRNMRGFGFDLEDMESKELMKVMNIALPQPGKQDKVADEIVSAFEEFNPSRAVLDPFSALSIPVTGTKLDLQSYIHWLLGRLSSFSSASGPGCTTLLTCEVSANADQIGSGVEEYMADGIIVLYYLMRGKAKIKAIEIRKMRGTKHSDKATLLEITDRGIVIDPDIELTS